MPQSGLWRKKFVIAGTIRAAAWRYRRLPDFRVSLTSPAKCRAV
jgi:hypothetical protein